jgi:hypothetical protein
LGSFWPSGGPEPSTATAPPSPPRLLLVSFAILFVELSSIRWLNATVQVLVYFNNLILISCFFGLGLGCLLVRCRPLILVFGPALLVLVSAVRFLQSHGFEVSYAADVLFVGREDYYRSNILEISAAALAGFALNCAFFVILGQELGRQLTAIGRPLVAYGWDIGGSLVGVLAYTLFAYLRTAPHVWYGFAVLVLLTFVARDRRWLLLNAVCAMAALLLMRGTYVEAEWSPYYKVERRPFQEAQNRDMGFQILVDNLRIQDALAIGPELARSSLWPWLAYYEIPYHFKKPDTALILGAGAGNEAVVGRLRGAKQIDAVEIDPVIAEWGLWAHPLQPYSLPHVTVIVDDARSWISTTSKRYDLIVMSALDSHKQIAGASSLRLKSYVYTVESFRAIRERLAPGGVFCLSLSSTRAWMGHGPTGPSRRRSVVAPWYSPLQTVPSTPSPTCTAPKACSGMTFYPGTSGSAKWPLPRLARGSCLRLTTGRTST